MNAHKWADLKELECAASIQALATIGLIFATAVLCYATNKDGEIIEHNLARQRNSSQTPRGCKETSDVSETQAAGRTRRFRSTRFE